VFTCVSTQIDEPSPDELDRATATLKMLADRTRLHIVWALLHGEHSVNDLAEHVDVAPAAVSQHLAKLRLARLVRVRRDGTRQMYTVDNDHILRLVTEALFQEGHTTSTGAKHHTTRRVKAS
jgi:DNA-binding transcriptional ArsR family regulator